MITLTMQTLTTWTRSLFGEPCKPSRTRKTRRKRQEELARAINSISAEDRRAFFTLFDELDKLTSAPTHADHARMFYLTIQCYRAHILDEGATVAWLAELARYSDLEEAYKIALERYAQKGEA